MKKLISLMLAIMLSLGAFAVPAFAETDTTEQPTQLVTEQPTSEPTATEQPTDIGSTTEQPTAEPTDSEQPTDNPAATNQPTGEPNATDVPLASFDVTGGDYTTIKEGDWRVVMGADLTSEQRAQVYSVFGIENADGDPHMLNVTNAEERFYFEGKIPSEQIGTRSISCIYIKALKKGKGLEVRSHNIDYCTVDMYTNVLQTVGITDALVIVAAPTSVSGTAALTGIYKAYESLTGQILSDYLKAAGIEELITTGQLAELIGSDDATAIITELKKILDQTQNMSDEEVEQKIREIAAEYNVTLTDNQVTQIRILARTLEGLDVEQIRDRVMGLANATSGWERFTDAVSTVVEDIGNFFKDIAKFLTELFDKMFGGEKA